MLKKMLLICFSILLTFPMAIFAEDSKKVVNVSDYTTINDAINAVYNSGGGSVLFEEGVYLRSSNNRAIQLKSGVSLIGKGKGTVFFNDGTQTNSHSIELIGNAGNPVMVTEDVKSGANAGKPPYAVKVSDVSTFSVNSDVEIKDSFMSEFNEVVSSDASTNTVYLRNRPSHQCTVINSCSIAPINLIKNVEIKNITFDANDTSGSAIRVNYAKNVRIDGNSIASNVHGIWAENAENITISSNSFERGFHAISLWGTVRKSSAMNNSISHTTTGVLLSGHRIQVIGNTITNVGTNNNGDGVTIGGNASDNVVQGNTIEGGECYGIWVSGTNPKRNHIIGNIIRSNITAGINVSKGESIDISNNTIISNSNGINVDKVKGVIIIGNIISENYARGILTTGSGTMIFNNVIQDNAKEAVYVGSSDVIIKNNIVRGAIYVPSTIKSTIQDNVLN